MKYHDKRILEDSHERPQSCPNCSALFNVFPVSGEREITGDGNWEDVLWQCDDCGTRWFVRVAADDPNLL